MVAIEPVIEAAWHALTGYIVLSAVRDGRVTSTCVCSVGRCRLRKTGPLAAGACCLPRHVCRSPATTYRGAMNNIALHSAAALALACGGFMLAGNPRCLATAFDTTPTTGTTTTPTLTESSGAGPYPTAAISRPQPGTRLSRAPLTYRIKVGRPVTWWFTVADPSSFYDYGLNVFRGTNYSRTVAGTGVLAFYPQHPRVTMSWTWNKPPRGTYTCLLYTSPSPRDS